MYNKYSKKVRNMIYINENTTTVTFPKTSTSDVNSIEIINQTTKERFTVDVTDISSSSSFYKFDLSESLHLFTNGQYDYKLLYRSETVETGVLQYGDFYLTNNQYDTNIEITTYGND